MRVRFTKMHGLGNDFVVLDARDAALPELSRETIRRIAHRHEGIGCDQLIVLEPAQGEADCAMRIFNADGGEAGACGNASRAVALLIGRRARIATAGGLIEAVPQHSGGASVDMGVPRFEWDAIPLAYALDTQALPLAWESLANPAAVNVGNPHAVFFVEDVEAVPLAKLGPIIETDPVFAEGVNVNVASVESAERIRLRVWERGAGLTRACGTGACATAIAAMRRGLTGRAVTVALPGGELAIAWNDDGRIMMSGPATESFRGDFAWEDYA